MQPLENLSGPCAIGDRTTSPSLASQASESLNTKTFSAVRDTYTKSTSENFLPTIQLTNTDKINMTSIANTTDTTRSQTRQPGEAPGEQRTTGRTSSQNPWNAPREGQPQPSRQAERPSEQSKQKMETPSDGKKQEAPSDGKKQEAPDAKAKKDTNGDARQAKPENPNDHRKQEAPPEIKSGRDRPAEQQKPGDKKPPTDVEVKRGDTLWSIAKKQMQAEHPEHTPSPKEIFKMIYEIARTNGIPNINQIHPGQRLHMPKH